MCVMCSTSVPTLFQYFFYDHIRTFLYIFHEMFFITCLYIQWNLRIADGLGPLIISVIRRLGLNRRLRIECHSTTEPYFYCLYEPNAYLKQFSVVLEGIHAKQQ